MSKHFFTKGEKWRLPRREFLRRSTLLSLGALFGLPSCETFFQPSPYLVFQQLDSGCASAEEGASLQGGQGKVTLSGVIVTPTPCYDLQAELLSLRCGPAERCLKSYEVAITAKAQEGSCIECIGSIFYQGEIRGLAAGSYTIIITHDGRPIVERRVQVW